MSDPLSTNPLVSILIPSYNQGRFLPATLDSILSQDYRPLEIIVMDGGSKDDTVSVLESYSQRHPEIRWRSEPDKGVADAVNKCLAEARGVYAGIQSSDDLYLPGAISEAVAELSSDPGLGLVFGDAEHIDADGRFCVLVRNPLPFTHARFLARSLIIHQSSAFFRLDVARDIGGWRDEYFCADTEMWFRLMFEKRVKGVDRVWSSRRLHDAQRDHASSEMWEAWGRMIADSPQLAAAGWRERRAAAAGRRLMAIHYNPRGTRAFPVVQAWRAILTYPPSYRGVYPKAVLLGLRGHLDPGKRLRRAGRAILERAGYDVARAPRPDDRYQRPSFSTQVEVPAGAAEELRPDNPRLMELRRRYAISTSPMATRTMWHNRYVKDELDLVHFRGDNAFVWQLRNMGAGAAQKYYLYLRDLASRDKRGLLQALREDGAFGAWTFTYPGWPVVSRDLLDSVNELYFLHRHTGLLDSDWTVLDIGAGYGRLAHRMLTAAPKLRSYLCVDGVAESTFLSEYYLRFRGCTGRAEVIALDEVDDRLPGRRVDLAVSIHSFSEMSTATIDGWLSWLSRLQVPWLLVVPNDAHLLLASEADGERPDFGPLLTRHGYELVEQEPVFPDPTMRELMEIEDHFFLFKRAADHA